MDIGNTKVIQVTNIAPQATRDQMHTLFAHLGKIEEVRLYPSVRDASISVTSRVCFLKFFDGEVVPVALHMTNTVFIDRAIIVQPFTNGDIPDELCGLEMANSALPRGVNESKLPPYVTNEIEGEVVKTYDPKLESTGLPHYPALPSNMDNRLIEEIRRTIVVIGLDSTTTAQQCMEYFASEAGEVKYFRYCTRDNDAVKYALIEFTDHGAVIPAFRLNNTILGTACIQVYHATQAIVKPQAKTNEAAQKEIEEAMKKVKEAQNLVSAAVDPLMGMLGVPRGGRNTMDRSRSRSMDRGYGGYSRDKRRRRSRSRSRRRSRSRSRDRRRRSRSRETRRRRSRTRSRDRRRRSKSREKRRKSRSKSKDRRKRSKSRDKKEKKDDDKKKEEETKVKTEEEAKPASEAGVENGAGASEAAVPKIKEEGASNENGGNEGNGNGNEEEVKEHKEEKKERSKSRSRERKRSRSRDRKRSRSRDRKRSRSRSRTKKSKRDRSRSRDRRRRSRSRDRRRRSRSKSHDRDHRHKKSKKNKRDKSIEREKKVDDKKIARDYDEEEEGFENRADEGPRVKEEKLEAVDMEISNSP